MRPELTGNIRVPRLSLDKDKIDRARGTARRIAVNTLSEIQGKTTVAVEQAVLRLLGGEGLTLEGVPWANVIVDRLLSRNLLGCGAAAPFVSAVLAEKCSEAEVAGRIAAGLMAPFWIGIFFFGQRSIGRRLSVTKRNV